MAKNTTNKETEASVEAEVTVDTEATEITEERKMVTIRLPKIRKDQEDLYVACNGERFIVKRGVEVDVPDYVAEIIRHSEEMREIAMR